MPFPTIPAPSVLSALLCLAGCSFRTPLPAPAPPATAAGPRVPRIETRTWRQGEPAVRLIRKSEGFCALSLVTGAFSGGGEVVKVWVAPDGYWYLGGQSGQEGVAAQCIVVHYQ